MNEHFLSWLEDRSEELVKDIEWFTTQLARHEIENRLVNYPKVRNAISAPDFTINQLHSRVKECWALGHQQDLTRLNQFALMDGAEDAVRALLVDFPNADGPAASRIDTFVNAAIELGYSHPETHTPYKSSAGLLASVLLTAIFPQRFVDFRHIRWKKLSDLLDVQVPKAAPDEYGNRIVWAGRLAQSIAKTATFQRYWPVGEPMWIIAGICWSANDKHAIERIEKDRIALPDADLAYPDGKRRWHWHSVRERNTNLVKAAKDLWLQRDPLLRCAGCGFSYEQAYGDLGTGYIEAHHRVPLSQLELGQQTKIDDLVPVCANCHRMLHRKKGATMEVEALAKLLQDDLH